MRRTLALCAAAVLLRAAPAAADPNDLDLARLGAPLPSIWQVVDGRLRAAGYLSTPPLSDGDALRLATESQQRYRLTALQLGLALSSAVLEPPTTGGPLTFDVALEGGYAQISHDESGRMAAPFGEVVESWPVRGPRPQGLRLAALHVRKPLPFSFELGGRFVYVDQSQMGAAQAELRWVVNENWWVLPDFALRFAYTRLFGQRDLDLHVVDLDAVVGKRFGMGGSARLTPYGAVRMSLVGARTTPIDFAPTAFCPSACYPDARTPKEQVQATSAPFAEMRFRDHRVLRYALGLDLDAGAFRLGLEAGYQASKRFAARTDLDAVTLPSSWSGAFRLGLHF